LPALLATLHDLIIGGAIAAALLVPCLLYAEARKERSEPTKVEVEEYRDWLWPERKTGPASRIHLGRRG
jgi:hypothetical protein